MQLIEHKTVVNSSNVLDLIKDYDIIIDGTDNFPTRYCVNDACVIPKKPNVYGSIFRFEGMVTVFAPHLENPDSPANTARAIAACTPSRPTPARSRAAPKAACSASSPESSAPCRPTKSSS